MGKRRFLLIVLSVAVMVAVVAPCANASTIELISVNSAGEVGNCYSHTPSISYDGRYVAFESCADNLVANDTNGSVHWIYGYDVFVHDRTTGTTKRVSVDSNGNQFDVRSGGASISGNGIYVAFANEQVFVYDLQTGATEPITSTIGRGAVGGANINYDGRYVTFVSNRYQVPGIESYWLQTYVHDRTTGITKCLSVDSNGSPGNQSSAQAKASKDGRFVTFWSLASNLVPGDTNGAWDVFVRDMDTGTIERIAANAGDYPWYPSDSSLSISLDGRYVAFMSSVYDRATGVTEEFEESGISISGDGRYTTYVGQNPDNGWPYYIYVKDRVTGATEIASIYANGEIPPPGGGNFEPAISGDGRSVAFTSDTPLVPSDLNNAPFFYDVYVHDIKLGTPDTIEEATAAVEELLTSGDISNAGTATSLMASLDSALQAQENGNINAASNALLAFINKVQAQAGKNISEEAAALLIEAANQILATLQ